MKIEETVLLEIGVKAAVKVVVKAGVKIEVKAEVANSAEVNSGARREVIGEEAIGGQNGGLAALSFRAGGGVGDLCSRWVDVRT